ncbi:MAG: hypothetical protein SGJ27_14595 [Candidatus Melainabacteria bacterium]|nr:hypothetical protein [Candidatus Melainabacteria bacterium]
MDPTHLILHFPIVIAGIALCESIKLSRGRFWIMALIITGTSLVIGLIWNQFLLLIGASFIVLVTRIGFFLKEKGLSVRGGYFDMLCVGAIFAFVILWLGKPAQKPIQPVARVDSVTSSVDRSVKTTPVPQTINRSF